MRTCANGGLHPMLDAPASLAVERDGARVRASLFRVTPLC